MVIIQELYRINDNSKDSVSITGDTLHLKRCEARGPCLRVSCLTGHLIHGDLLSHVVRHDFELNGKILDIAEVTNSKIDFLNPVGISRDVGNRLDAGVEPVLQVLHRILQGGEVGADGLNALLEVGNLDGQGINGILNLCHLVINRLVHLGDPVCDFLGQLALGCTDSVADGLFIGGLDLCLCGGEVALQLSDLLGTLLNGFLVSLYGLGVGVHKFLQFGVVLRHVIRQGGQKALKICLLAGQLSLEIVLQRSDPGLRGRNGAVASQRLVDPILQGCLQILDRGLDRGCVGCLDLCLGRRDGVGVGRSQCCHLLRNLGIQTCDGRLKILGEFLREPLLKIGHRGLQTLNAPLYGGDVLLYSLLAL
ncbi:unknown [Alistipes sp. CAG:514]|nr:unknown [Alistipes sp. CAG:514]